MIKHNLYKLLVLTFLIFLCIGSKAQDVHFSQSFANPILLNPALAGAFNGQYRIGTAYRSQWSRVTVDPYRTFGLNVDLRFNLRGRSLAGDAIGAGILFYSDKTPEINFNTNQMSFVVSYHKSLDSRKTQYLTAGFMLSIIQRSVNFRNLIFQDQFNGVDGFDLQTSEDLPENAYTKGDLSFGLNYTGKLGVGKSIFAGISGNHITNPNYSFFQDDPDSVFEDSPLHIRWSAYGSARIKLNGNIILSPRIIGHLQGPHSQVTLGTTFRQAFSDFGSEAVHYGSWLRLTGDTENSFALESVILFAGFEFQNFLLGLSYDLNPKSLTELGRLRSAFEVTFSFLGNYDNDLILCPKF